MAQTSGDRARQRRFGRLLLAIAGLVILALAVVPWVAARLVPWSWAPALAAFLVLLPTLYLWFRRVQQTSPRTAVALALVHAALAGGVLWLWGRR